MATKDLAYSMEVLAEGWRRLAAEIRERDKHSPVANELDNCADDVTGIVEGHREESNG